MKNRSGKWLGRLVRSPYWALTSALVSIGLAVIFGLPSLLGYLQSREPVDITGDWKVSFHIMSSTYAPYVGLTSGYKIFLNQKNQVITGRGESWEFDGPPHYEAHRPVVVDGKISDRSVVLQYTLTGQQRTTVGTVRLRVSEDGDRMEGDFVGTGADAKGTVLAEKL